MIKNKLRDDIEKYCKLNDIEDIESFINKMIRKGFTIEKFGELKPKAKSKEEKAEEIGDDYDPTEVKEEIEEVVEEVVHEEVKEEEPKPVKVRVSPHARKLIEKYDLDISFIDGTGKNGGITKKDVEKYLSENGIEKKEGNIIIREKIREVKVNKSDIYGEDDFAQYGSNLLDNK